MADPCSATAVPHRPHEEWRERLRRHPGARRRVHDALGRARSSRSTRPRRVDLRRDGDDRIGLPGGFPFTRGVYPSMYRGRLWTMRQFAGFGTAEETNERFRYLLDHGQTGLTTAFDMPSLMGHDSDHAQSLGEVGREGVAVDTLDDMADLFEGIDLGEVSVSMTINAPAAIMLAFYVVAAEAAGRARRAPRRHDPGRHPQGVHRPEGVVLPGRPGDAPDGRHDRVVLARRCRAGTRSRSRATTSARPARPPQQELAFTLKDGLTYVEQARRPRPRRRRLRAAPVVLLQRPDRLLRGDRQVPRRAPDLGARAARHLRRQEPAVVADALPHADRGRLADRPAAAQQHRPHGDRGAAPACSAARSRCTPTPTTRRSRCRPRRRCGSRCAPSRSSPTRPASPTRSTRSAAATSSSR